MMKGKIAIISVDILRLKLSVDAQWR